MYITSLYGGVGIALFAAVMGLALFSQAIRSAANGLFTLLCLSGSVYLFYTAEWYSTTDYVVAVNAIKQQTNAAILSCAFFVWFIAYLSHQEKAKYWLFLHSIISVILLFANQYIYEFSVRFATVTPTEVYVFPWGEKIGHFSGIASEISLVVHTFYVLTFVWGLWCGLCIYKLFSRPIATLHLFYLLFTLVAAFCGVLVDRGILPAGYFAGYGFMLMLIVGCLSVAREQRTLLNSTSEQNKQLKDEIQQRMKAEKKISEVAFYDEVTGLTNRAGLFDQFPEFLQSQNRHQQRLACFLINLTDVAKLYSDYGVEFVDGVLREVASSLSKWAGEDALVARTKDNQFAVLRSISPNQVQKLEYISQVNQWDYNNDILEAFNFLDKKNPLRAKIGVAVLHPDEDNLHRVLLYAKRAVRESSVMPGNSMYLYSEAFHSKVEWLSRVETDLLKAVKSNQLSLYFQPKLNSSKELIGAEALLRWNHPEYGYISPDVFIPLAEHSKQINLIGNWVLSEACRCLYNWRKRGVPFCGRLAVNVSPCQLQSDHLLVKIDELLHELSLPARALEVEVTESSIVDNNYGEAERLESLRMRGITIAIDDFGTGYSSLSRLHDLPIDTLKIDKSFVEKIGDVPTSTDAEDVVAGIIAIARAMKMGVVAEGVETQAQQSKLVAMGCDQFQGYFFARPLPEAEFVEFVRSLERHQYKLHEVMN